MTRLVGIAGVSLPLAGALALTTAGSAVAATSAAVPILPAPSTAPLKPFVARVAIGSPGQVAEGSHIWAADTASNGGRDLAITSTGGNLARLLSHERSGATSFSVRVPSAGVYRVSLLIPKVASVQHANLVSGSEPLLSGLSGTTAKPQVVSFSIGTTGTLLSFGFSSGTVPVSGAEVTAVSTLPSDHALVPVRVAFSNVPATSYDLPGTVPTPATWASGAWPGGLSNDNSVTAFGNARHRVLDVIATSLPGSSWKDLATDFYGIDEFHGQPARLAIAVPMLPYDKSGSFAQVTSGAVDWVFRDVAADLVKQGRPDSIVRLGWEFDGTWQPWAATNPTAYIAAFRHEVAVLRSVDPKVIINWNGSWGPSGVGHTTAQLYPGDDVVDQIGVDAYDRVWFHVHDAASWNYYETASQGLNAWYSFAVQHHKLFSVPEWGLYNDNGSQTDNPYYISVMHTWFALHASGLAYEAYFNDNNSWDGTQIINTQGGASLNPVSGAYYSEIWG